MSPLRRPLRPLHCAGDKRRSVSRIGWAGAIRQRPRNLVRKARRGDVDHARLMSGRFIPLGIAAFGARAVRALRLARAARGGSRNWSACWPRTRAMMTRKMSRKTLNAMCIDGDFRTLSSEPSCSR